MALEPLLKPLTTGEVARAFGVHPSTVLDWAESGKLRCFKTPGGNRRFHRADVEALMQSEPTEQAS